VAHQTAWRAIGLVIRRFLAAASVLALGGVVIAGTPLPALGPYRASERTGATGAIEGRAYAERRTPLAADIPLTDLTVTLMPLSQDLLTGLEDLKAGARDSMRAYRTVALEISRRLTAYLEGLRKAGAADLLRSGSTGSTGQFSFSGVPAGQWLLLGRRDVKSRVVPRQAEPQETAPFTLGPRVLGHRAASFWLLPLTVTEGRSIAVELTDRSIWYTGVIEETR
jgi:hypothetical protein